MAELRRVPLVPNADYGPPKEDPRRPAMPLPPPLEEDEEGAFGPPPSLPAPAEPTVPENFINLETGMGMYRGFPVKLTEAQLKVVHATCISSLETTFTEIIKGLKNEIPDEGR